MATFARSATVSQLRRTLRHHHFGTDRAEETRAPAGLTQGFDADGRYRLRAVMDADEGAIVRQALQEAHDALFRGNEGRVSGTDALVEIARRSLGGVEPLSRREAFLAVFHVPIGSSPGHLHGGPALPDQLRRQLLCDGRGMVVAVRHGRPVSLGRSTRIVPTRLRQLIEERDRGCRVRRAARRRGSRSTTFATGRTAGGLTRSTSCHSAIVTTGCITVVGCRSTAIPSDPTVSSSPIASATASGVARPSALRRAGSRSRRRSRRRSG